MLQFQWELVRGMKEVGVSGKTLEAISSEKALKQVVRKDWKRLRQLLREFVCEEAKVEGYCKRGIRNWKIVNFEGVLYDIQ